MKRDQFGATGISLGGRFQIEYGEDFREVWLRSDCKSRGHILYQIPLMPYFPTEVIIKQSKPLRSSYITWNLIVIVHSII